jgi:hypothetical protein
MVEQTGSLLDFHKDRMERIKANCQFALHSLRDFHFFKASHRDTLNS